jgi:hypothetical protein
MGLFEAAREDIQETIHTSLLESADPYFQWLKKSLDTSIKSDMEATRSVLMSPTASQTKSREVELIKVLRRVSTDGMKCVKKQEGICVSDSKKRKGEPTVFMLLQFIGKHSGYSPN